MGNFESTVAAGLGSYPPGAVFLAAVSGGADSTAMLAALLALREQGGFTLHCIHIEHGIRPAEESRGDARAVKKLCGEWGVPCRVVSIPPGLIAETARRFGTGIEAAARHYRRRAWTREAHRIGALAVLTAHTGDDALETALMRVLRGSGPAGLAAMTPERGLIRRPLLGLGRADVLCYLAERHIPYRTDSTNQDIRYLRNRIRHRLIPLLDEFFPHWKKGVGAMAETQGLTAAFLAAEASGRVPWETVPGGSAFPKRSVRTPAENFFSQPPIIREEALFRGIDAFKALSAGAIGVGGIGGGARGIDGDERPVKRSSLRLFSSERPTADMGFCRISMKDAFVMIAPGGSEGREAGFSLLIKAPGIYKLKETLVLGETLRDVPLFSLEVWPAGDAGPANAHLPAGGTGGFFAVPPVLIRRSFNDDFITGKAGRRLALPDIRARRQFRRGAALYAAVDSLGVAAFIGAGLDGMIHVQCRDDGAAIACGDRSFLWFVPEAPQSIPLAPIPGGIDAE
jgi:tRNA(Ile)-lysidine synthase